jgi:aminodeoxyfutalosine deaminase
MPQFTADWLLPISQAPIRNGWVRTRGGRIVAMGSRTRGERGPSEEIDLGHVALMPGLVNAHTHLELSWMRGLLPPGGDFPAWIRGVIALQRAGAGSAESAADAITAAIAEGQATGTVLFGDISNTLASVGPLIAQGAAALVFHELIGFGQDRAPAAIEAAQARLRALPSSPSVRYSLAAHAPYSVSPALFRGIQSVLAREPSARWSVHLGESAAETEFLQNGSGPWRRLLEDLGSWDPSWVAPGCTPVEYLERMDCLDASLLAVHGVQLGEAELTRLAGAGVTLVTCPRGNRLTGAGSPPVAMFYAADLAVAIGTDSLASVPDLDIFSELAELRRLAPAIPASRLLASATLNGARALGFESDYGSIEEGKLASLITVAVPPDIPDVAEYLVHGILRTDISRLEAA